MIMKYRWGFLDENDNFTECEPKVEDTTAIDFARESNEMFYRAKLNGSLAFRFEFDDIIAQGYNVEHRVVLQSFDNDLNDWREIWRGRFALTDCEIDYDTNTITVTPATLDRYTPILDHLEDDHNLIKLAPEQLPVDILIRPLVQIYEVRDIKISNYIGNNYWEKNCDSVSRNDIDNYKFGLQKQYISIGIQYTDQVNPDYPFRAGKNILYVGEVIYGGLPQESTRVYGQYWDGAAWQTDTLRVRVAQYTSTTDFQFYSNPDLPGSQQSPIVTATYEAYGMGTIANVTIDAPLTVADAYSQWDMVCARILVQSDLASIDIHGQTYTLDDIPSNDMAGSNQNYNKVFYADMIEIKVSNEVQAEPTQWGCNYKDEYFVRPVDSGVSRWMPVGQSLWKYFSVWWRIDAPSVMAIINEELTAEQTIKDCYPVMNVVAQLMAKQGWNGNIISGCFGNENYVGAQTYPVITPKSNVISSYYDTPAQNATINMAKIFSMLKQAYKVYWYLDSNNDLHFEHVSYFDNGFSYAESEPDVLIDLDTTIHTNTKNAKDFGQNKVKFDKQDMPQTFDFGWMDMQTKPFDGWPIRCLDNYVQKGLTDEMIVGDFSTDIDYILSSPNDVSKDGFALFALPYVEGAYSTKLKIDRLLIKDEIGDQYYVELQNADAAFVKIHRTWWKYQLPCENVNINNEDTNAITTGNFKTQAIEFADMSMAELLTDANNANKIFRTQQGDGHVKTISVNLNSLSAKGDLLFNFIGRWYYLRGTALGASITIFVNGESTTIEVKDNKFVYRYKEPISALTFNAADVVSVNFADCDNLDDLTSCDSMFDGCEELLAVDFGNKTFGAVTTANDMFRGCVALTTLICPDSSSWKADLDLSDCPALTLESLYDLIKFLYFYNAGVHTITPNTTFWNALDGDTQNDLIAKATERGWTINMPAAYSVTGQSAANTVYATINGSAVEIPVVGGSWQYDYNAPITSISFENDADLTSVDFSLSDGLAGVTSLNDAFKNCAGLTVVDFTDCDLSNVASASDAFAGCVALTDIIIPAGTWKPDIDLSDTAIVYADMSNVINGLFTYSTGTHTILFNSTIWDALTQPQQQTISDAAQLKGWTTNAVMVIYVIRGTSSKLNDTETFTIGWYDETKTASDFARTETISVNTDSSGNWEFSYQGELIRSLASMFLNSTTILSVDFSDADNFSVMNNAYWAFDHCTNLVSVDFSNTDFGELEGCGDMFDSCTHLTTIVGIENFTFAKLLYARHPTFGGQNGMFYGCTALQSIDLSSATFAECLNTYNMFYGCSALQSVDLSSATFAKLQTAQAMFANCTNLATLNVANATFEALTTAIQMINGTKIVNLDLSKATFENLSNGGAMFYNNQLLETITWSANLNLDKLQTTNFFQGMFMRCRKLKTLNWHNQTLPLVANMANMFEDCNAMETIDLHSATMPNSTSFTRMLVGCNKLQSIDMANATWQNVTNCVNAFATATLLTTIVVPQNSTAMSLSGTTANISLNLSSNPLTYASILAVANWLKDFTGYSAPTLTYKATAWNALSAAEQSTIDGILSGKNWTRAIA